MTNIVKTSLSTIPRQQVEERGAIFERGGADVTISWRQGGHELAKDDVRAAKIWLSKKFAKELRHRHEQEEPTGKDTDCRLARHLGLLQTVKRQQARFS